MKDKNKDFFKVDSDDEYYDLVNHYYDLFMSIYSIEGLTSQENDFILRKFWADGRVSSFRLNSPIPLIGFAKFEANGQYNYLDYPIKARPTSTRDTRGLFPKKYLEVGKDIIIGYARYNKKPVSEHVTHIIKKMIALEKAFKRNSKALSIPIAAGATQQNKTKLDEFFNKLDGDTDKLVFDFNDGMEKPYLLWSGIPYYLDKFYAQIKAYDCEILTYFGINNLGSSEKKEHLITGEIDVNNDIITTEDDNFARNIKRFLDETNVAFGTNYRLKKNRNTATMGKKAANETADGDNKEDADND